MSTMLEFLQLRNSAPRLGAPGPSDSQLSEMIQAAIRAPDHARLRPWRFIAISGERRQDLGELLERCLVSRDCAADEAARTKARNAPLRAPLIVVVVARIQQHPKVPAIEQHQSAACAAHSLLLAAEALGFAGVWRTGASAFDRNVMDALGLNSDEEITGFIYLGSRDGAPKPLPDLHTEDFLSHW